MADARYVMSDTDVDEILAHLAAIHAARIALSEAKSEPAPWLRAIQAAADRIHDIVNGLEDSTDG